MDKNQIVIIENVASNGLQEYRAAFIDPSSLQIGDSKIADTPFLSPVAYLENFGNSKTHYELASVLLEVNDLMAQYPGVPVTSITIKTSFDTFLYNYWTYFAENVLPAMEERAKDNPELLLRSLLHTIKNYAATQALRRYSVQKHMDAKKQTS